MCRLNGDIGNAPHHAVPVADQATRYVLKEFMASCKIVHSVKQSAAHDGKRSGGADYPTRNRRIIRVAGLAPGRTIGDVFQE